MQHHLDVMGDKVRETFAYTDFESLEIYGALKRGVEGIDPTCFRGRFTHHPVDWGRAHSGWRLGTDTLSGMNTTRLKSSGAWREPVASSRAAFVQRTTFVPSCSAKACMTKSKLLPPGLGRGR